MVTKGYIVHVYDENGTRLDNASGRVLNPNTAVTADVWLPIFDTSNTLNSGSTIGRAELSLIPHTTIPLQTQIGDKRSAVFCAIQDFDLSTLVILGYVKNANNDSSAPYANMELGELTVRDKFITSGEFKIKLSEKAKQKNNLNPKKDFYVSQEDLEALYGVGNVYGVGNIQRAFEYTSSVISNFGTMSGFYSASVEGSSKYKVIVDLITWDSNSNLSTEKATYKIIPTGADTCSVFRNGSSVGSFSKSQLGISVYSSSGALLNNYPGTIILAFNSAVPVSAGGTGATNSEEAKDNLGIYDVQVLSKSEMNGILSKSDIRPNTIFYIYT